MSSVGLVFRALVMLACLALVPFLAIYGKQLPDFYHAVVDAYKARTQAKPADPLAGLGSDAPDWAPTNDRRSSDLASGSRDGSAKNSQSTPPAALASTAWGNGADAAKPLNARPSAIVNPGAVQPASYASGAEPGKSAERIATSARDAATTAAATGPAGPDSCTAQFRHVEGRLRELGATYYLLETFGDGYRFYCEVAIDGNADSGRKRAFQATDPDPLTAMKRVLDQVESFRKVGAVETRVFCPIAPPIDCGVHLDRLPEGQGQLFSFSLGMSR